MTGLIDLTGLTEVSGFIDVTGLTDGFSDVTGPTDGTGFIAVSAEWASRAHCLEVPEGAGALPPPCVFLEFAAGPCTTT